MTAVLVMSNSIPEYHYLDILEFGFLMGCLMDHHDMIFFTENYHWLIELNMDHGFHGCIGRCGDAFLIVIQILIVYIPIIPSLC